MAEYFKGLIVVTEHSNSIHAQISEAGIERLGKKTTSEFLPTFKIYIAFRGKHHSSRIKELV